MTHRPTHPDERWLHAVPGSWTAGSAAALARSEPWAGSEPGARLLDAPVVFGLRSRGRPPGGQPHDLDRHAYQYGPRPLATGVHGDSLLDCLQQAALTGRGGGHFPVAVKWRAALAAGGGGTVVANGAEGEPASAKDAALLQLRPHLVLDGLALAAETMGARDAVVWLHEGDHATHQAVTRAVAERRSAGDLPLTVRVAVGPDHYLTGESSSVVRALSGGPALPYLARRPAAVQGVAGRPTLLHNAETLARVALVARFGPGGDSDGALVTVVGPSWRVVVGVSAGETFGQLVARTGMVAGVPQAVLVGGYGGSWLPWAKAAGAQVSASGLASLGASLGAGVVAPLPAGACGIAQTARLVEYLAASSARQCGPCMFGLPAVADLVTRLATGRAGRGDLKTLRRYAGEVAGRGACHHPDGALRLVWSALRVFEADVLRHVAGQPCAGACGPALLPVPEVG